VGNPYYQSIVPSFSVIRPAMTMSTMKIPVIIRGSTNPKGTGILGRYKYVNNPDGNSPIASTGSTTVNAFTLYPDQEDINNDNTMNTLEQYFEYKVNLFHQYPDSFGTSMGQNFITDSIGPFYSQRRGVSDLVSDQHSAGQLLSECRGDA
jgi:hypothetical protein